MPRETLVEQFQGELEPEGVGRSALATLQSTSAPRALHEPRRRRTPACWSSARPGRGRWAACLPGSTADRLMHGAPCPIAVVPTGWRADDGP